MSRNDNGRVGFFVVMCACFGAALTVPAFASPDAPKDAPAVAPAVAPADGARPAKAKRHPLVVLKQSQIRGKVLFLPDAGEGPAVPARQLDVTVTERDGSKVLHKTLTQDDGSFALPDLEVGLFRIKVGRLVLELSVEAQPETSAKPLPKTLLIYMPRELEK